MLAHRLRQWPSIVPTLGERLVLAGWGCTERSAHSDTTSAASRRGGTRMDRDRQSAADPDGQPVIRAIGLAL